MIGFKNILVLVMFVAIPFCATYAWGHDPEHKNTYGDWFVSQMQEGGTIACCGDIDTRGGDAHYANVMNSGDKYYVSIDGQWVLYPNPVRPYYLNPTGENVVW